MLLDCRSRCVFQRALTAPPGARQRRKQGNGLVHSTMLTTIWVQKNTDFTSANSMLFEFMESVITFSVIFYLQEWLCIDLRRQPQPPPPPGVSAHKCCAQVCFVDTLAGDLSMAARAPPLVSSGGSAVRRRERRLRRFWRHEHMAIQMALATVTHHSFQVGTAHDALLSQKPVTSAGGMRPPPLVELRPQVWIQRHTVEQRIEHTPHVQILDAPVPQKVEQLVDFFKDLDSHVLVQVIEVPKISQDIIPQRSVDLVPQMAEQLVEVPTLLSVAVLQQRTAEQLASIPVPRGRHGRLPGSLPGQGSTASAAEQIADIPSSSGDLQGFRPRQSSTAVSAQNISTPAPCRGGLHGGLHGFPPVQGSAVDFPVFLGDADEGVFRTFSHRKKCGVPGRSVRTCPGTSAHGPRRLMCSPGGSMRSSWRRRRRRTRATPSRHGTTVAVPVSSFTCPLLCTISLASFWAVYTGTRPWLTPAIWAGKGWRGRRELALRCSATQLGACFVGAYGETHTSYTWSAPQPPQPPQSPQPQPTPHHHHHHQAQTGCALLFV